MKFTASLLVLVSSIGLTFANTEYSTDPMIQSIVEKVNSLKKENSQISVEELEEVKTLNCKWRVLGEAKARNMTLTFEDGLVKVKAPHNSEEESVPYSIKKIKNATYLSINVADDVHFTTYPNAGWLNNSYSDRRMRNTEINLLVDQTSPSGKSKYYGEETLTQIVPFTAYFNAGRSGILSLDFDGRPTHDQASLIHKKSKALGFVACH